MDQLLASAVEDHSSTENENQWDGAADLDDEEFLLASSDAANVNVLALMSEIPRGK